MTIPADLIRDAAAEVDWALTDTGRNDEGQCAYAAVLGCVALGRRGVKAYLQAGSVLWRRIPADADPGPTGCDGFGYEWMPDEPASRGLIGAGMMPEYHAWCACPTPAGPGQPAAPRAVVVIDFSARWAPVAARRHGFAWEVPDPPYPLVLTENTPDTWYGVSTEATLTAALVMIDRMHYDGVADPEMYAACGGRRPPPGVRLTVADALRRVRRYMSLHDLREESAA